MFNLNNCKLLISAPDLRCVVQEKIKEMFENLMQVEHPNIVKFHKYWLDMKETQARVRIFLSLFFPHASSITLPHCAAAADTCPASSSSASPRSYSSPSTCHLGASSSS